MIGIFFGSANRMQLDEQQLASKKSGKLLTCFHTFALCGSRSTRSVI
jgi:hypothetical protein